MKMIDELKALLVLNENFTKIGKIGIGDTSGLLGAPIANYNFVRSYGKSLLEDIERLHSLTEKLDAATTIAFTKEMPGKSGKYLALFDDGTIDEVDVMVNGGERWCMCRYRCRDVDFSRCKWSSKPITIVVE